MPNQICKRCTIDSTVPGAAFDAQGTCSYCHLHDDLDRRYPLGPGWQERFSTLLGRLKSSSRGQKYDCVLGISGGRDSTFTLHLLKEHGINPLAVHFNDGFGNPVAGENMRKACDKLNVELRTVTSDWRETKDIRIAFLKASTPDVGVVTDIGVATALYGVAAKENVRAVVIGQSFRTEGIAPLAWNFMDGRYLRHVQRRFGSVKLKPWSPEEPGFNLGLRELFYYIIQRRIRTLPVLYYYDYVRSDVDKLIERELGWVNPGAHYFDDLYQALITYVMRVKFGIDRRKFNYAALVRSGQMSREEALDRISKPYSIEDPKIIDLCIKRLGLSKEEFEALLALPPKSFSDYPNYLDFLRWFKAPLWVAAKMDLIPFTSYKKYMEFDY